MFYPSPTIRVMADASRKISGMIMRDYYELQLLQNSRKSLSGFYEHLVRRASGKLEEELLKARPNFLTDIDSASHGDFWVFNVLEGRENFLHALPYFTISIAHVRRNNPRKEVVSSIVVAPAFKEMYFAELDKGAWFERFDMNQDRPEKLRVSGRMSKDDLLYVSNQNLGVAGLRNLGSNAIALSYLAAGRFDAVVIEKPDYKDIAAGLLIAKQAGAVLDVSDDRVVAATEYAKSQYSF